MIVTGINPVLEALRAGSVVDVRVAEHPTGRLVEVVRAAEAAGVRIRTMSREELDRRSGGRSHQGVVADVAGPRGYRLDELLAAAPEAPLVLVLDGVEDPQNVGALLRTADGAGVTGVVRQKRRAASLGGAAARASAGALAHVRIASVVNVARALEELKAAGVWTVGLVGGAARSYETIDYTLPTAVVVGSEGMGLRRLVRDRCDWLVSIPMGGQVESLNVSVAAGVVLFEATRQRRMAAGGGGARSAEPARRGP